MAKQLATSIAGGAWVEVQVDGVPILLAQGCSYSEDFNVQPLETLGFLGAREYESFGYTCEITLRWLIAKNKADYNRLVPKRSDIQKDGLLQDHVVTFVDISQQTVHTAFRGAVIARAGENIDANQFVAGDVTMFSVERIQ